MSLVEAIAADGAPWVSIWLYVLMLGGFILPAILLIWRESRLAGIVTLLAGVASALGTDWLYNQFGYVRLLGLPHVLFWTPVVIYLIARLRSGALRPAPKWIMVAVVATMLVSLIFDYTGVAQYLMGETAPFSRPAIEG